MAKAWHTKHISTRWGVAIILFLLVAGIAVVYQLGQNQIFQSHAMYNDYGHTAPCYTYIKTQGYVPNANHLGGTYKTITLRVPCLH